MNVSSATVPRSGLATTGSSSRWKGLEHAEHYSGGHVRMRKVTRIAQRGRERCQDQKLSEPKETEEDL